MQFKVPQDVQQADRIVAFLTLPQLIICVVGFAIAYGVYTALNSRGLTVVFWLPPVLVIGGLTISFAFLRIANLPFHQYLALLIERFITPSKRVWVKGSDRVIGEEDYVSPEEKKQEELAKKNTALQTEKEEKLGKIGEITDILDALKKAPEPLEEIDKVSDEELLQKAFLEKIEPEKITVPLPKKAEKPLEEKILEISSVPKPAQPIQKAAPIDQVKPIPSPAAPVVPQATIKPTNSAQNTVAEDSTKKKKKRRRRKKRSGNPPEGTGTVGPLKNTSTAPSVPTVPSIPSIPSVPSAPTVPTVPTVPSVPAPTPSLPSWLEEKPETAKEIPKSTAQETPVQPKIPPQQEVVEKKKETTPADKNPPVSSTPSVPNIPNIHTIPTIPTAPSPSEELLSAPAVEPSLPAPEEHLALEQEYADAPISNEPPTKTAQVSQSFTADDLKKGQTIKFPTS